MMYLKLSVAGHLTIFLTRTRGPFWSIAPARDLWIAVSRHANLATLIAVFGFLMPPLGWRYAAVVWGYALVWSLLNDRVKLLAYRIFDSPKAAGDGESKGIDARAKGDGEAGRQAMSSRIPRLQPAPEAKAEAKPDAKADASRLRRSTEAKSDAQAPDAKAARSQRREAKPTPSLARLAREAKAEAKPEVKGWRRASPSGKSKAPTDLTAEAGRASPRTVRGARAPGRARGTGIGASGKGLKARGVEKRSHR